MAMPAYIGGRFNVAGQKWYGSNIINPTRGLPRSILMVMLNDVDTCEPIATYMGYANRTFAPGYGVEQYGKNALHNILMAHGQAVKVLWNAGYSMKFGICSVNPITLERKPKRSALEYKKIIIEERRHGDGE
jgi:ornithine cyclodeaminase